MEKNNTSKDVLLESVLNNKDLENEIVKRMNDFIKHNFEGGIPYEEVKRNINNRLERYINDQKF